MFYFRRARNSAASVQDYKTRHSSATSSEDMTSRYARKRVRARQARRVLVVLFAMLLPVLCLLMAGWLAWRRGDVVVDVHFVE